MTDFALSADGSRAATAALDGTVRDPGADDPRSRSPSPTRPVPGTGRTTAGVRCSWRTCSTTTPRTDGRALLGAAVQAGIIHRRDGLGGVVLVDTTALSLGTAVQGEVFSRVIDANTRIPCSRTNEYVPAADYQPAVVFEVYQGESDLVAHNLKLGEFELALVPPRPRADAAAIRKAFRRLQQEHHPDRAPADRRAPAEAAFIRIGQAYELLSDREKRFQYDKLLEDLEGKVPPFEEAYLALKDEDKHPIYAAYDEYQAARRGGPEADGDEGDRPPGGGPDGGGVESAGEAPPPPADTPAVPLADTVPSPAEQPPEDVAMPASVREALGLPSGPTPAGPGGDGGAGRNRPGTGPRPGPNP